MICGRWRTWSAPWAQLESYAALPIANDRYKAGLVQGFEFTFEAFWKMFQKLAPAAGLSATSPREALIAAGQLHLILPDESSHWLQMLRDRNLSSHTYNVAVADAIVDRLLADYLPCFRGARTRLRQSVGAPTDG